MTQADPISVLRRRTSSKWRAYPPDVLPMFVAEMDYPLAPAIADALLNLLIAVTFVTTLLSAGYWAYTDALAALARSMDAMLSLRVMMVAALFGGAVAGGAIAGKLRRERPRVPDVLRCLVGGALMGIGASLVPGSNDGLILLGLPALLPHAWVAVATMALAIALAIRLSAVTGEARTAKP